jgi:hypothetical protein
MKETYLLRTASIQNVLANRAIAEGSNGLNCFGSGNSTMLLTRFNVLHSSQLTWLQSCTANYPWHLLPRISDLQLVVRWKARISQARKRRESGCCCLHAGFLFGLFFDTKDGGDVLQKCRLIFNGLHGIISHTASFITLAVRWEWWWCTFRNAVTIPSEIT